MKFDSSGYIEVVDFGHCEDEVGDSSGTRSVKAEATLGTQVDGMLGQDWGAEVEELCNEGLGGCMLHQ